MESTAGTGSQGGQEGGNNNFWSLLPSFDPANDNVKEYIDKVKFLEQVVPTKDKGMLAPRLALLCRGTAWAQVRAMDASKLSDPNTGVKHLLAALAGWEESAEMKTFDLFERAVYKTTQRADESTMSYGYGSKNRLDRPAVIRTSGTRGLRKGAWSRGFQGPN